MLALNCKTGKMCDTSKMFRGIININNDKCEFGYFSRGHYIFVYYNDSQYPILNSNILKYCYFDGNRGYYILKEPFKTGRPDIGLRQGHGRFPYSFSQMYEAIHCFDIFKNKQYILKEKDYDYSKYLEYTFGLEYETSQGYIPEDICLRDGLIPLRDGSITGVEYSTVVMHGNKGINYLKQQINTLKKYTLFDKECSLHVHMGLPRVSPTIVYNLYVISTIVQNELLDFAPKWTFESNRYKRTRKNYCSKIPVCQTFEKLFNFIAGDRFKGSLIEPHISDPDRSHKWQVSSRYFAFNFVNLLCYENPKTIEFRFLRPTYNYNEILTWLFVFNAIIKLAYITEEEISSLTYNETFEFINGKYKDLFGIIRTVYPDKLSNRLISNLKSICNIHSVLYNKADFAGLMTEVKEAFYENGDFNIEM